MSDPFDVLDAPAASDPFDVLDEQPAPRAVVNQPWLAGMHNAARLGTLGLAKTIGAGPALIEAAGRRALVGMGADPDILRPTSSFSPLASYLATGNEIAQGEANAASYDQRGGIPGFAQEVGNAVAGSVPAMAMPLVGGFAAKAPALATAAERALAAVKASAALGGMNTTATELQGNDQPTTPGQVAGAVAQGGLEWIFPRLGGATGVEAIFRERGPQAFRQIVTGLLREGGNEAFPEAGTGITQEIARQITENGRVTDWNAVDRAGLVSAAAGGVMGAGANLPGAVGDLMPMSGGPSSQSLAAAANRAALPAQSPGNAQLTAPGGMATPMPDGIAFNLDQQATVQAAPAPVPQPMPMGETGGALPEQQPNDMAPGDAAGQIAALFQALPPQTQQQAIQSIASLFQPTPQQGAPNANLPPLADPFGAVPAPQAPGAPAPVAPVAPQPADKAAELNDILDRIDAALTAKDPVMFPPSKPAPAPAPAGQPGVAPSPAAAPGVTTVTGSSPAAAPASPTGKRSLQVGQRVRFTRGAKLGTEATVASVLADGRPILRTDDGKALGGKFGITPDNLEAVNAPVSQTPVPQPPPAAPIAVRDADVPPRAVDTKTEQQVAPSRPVDTNDGMNDAEIVANSLMGDGAILWRGGDEGRWYTTDRNHARQFGKPRRFLIKVGLIKPVNVPESPEFAELGTAGEDADALASMAEKQFVNGFAMTGWEGGGVTVFLADDRTAEISEAQADQPVEVPPSPVNTREAPAQSPAAPAESQVPDWKSKAMAEAKSKIAQDAMGEAEQAQAAVDKTQAKRAEVQDKAAEAKARAMEKIKAGIKAMRAPTGRMGLGPEAEHFMGAMFDLAEAGVRTFQDAMLAIKEAAGEFARDRAFQRAMESAWDAAVNNAPKELGLEARAGRASDYLGKPEGGAADAASPSPAGGDTEGTKQEGPANEPASEPDGNLGSGTGSPAPEPGNRGGKPGRRAGRGRGNGAADGESTQGRDEASPDRGSAGAVPARDGDARSQVSPTKAGFHFDSVEDAMPPRGAITRARANIAAIKTAKLVMSEQRAATDAEKRVMVRFSGWGSLKWIFNPRNLNDPEKGAMVAAVREVLSDADIAAEAKAADDAERAAAEAYAKAKNISIEAAMADATVSTLNAHFTHPQVATEAWDMMRKAMGDLATQGKRLRGNEPSVGMGVFLGLEPEGMRGRVNWTAVEYEPWTAKLAKLVYDQHNVVHSGFERLAVPDSHYDFFIGNVPFGSYSLDFVKDDARYKSIKPLVHDHFFLRAVDKVRPGGLVGFITSTGTLDKQDADVRKALFAQADLVHAVRYPADAHATAGTAVVTDFIILRKRMPGEKRGSAAWLEVGTTQDAKGGAAIPINRWFVDHPELVLGVNERSGKLHGLDKNGEKRPNVVKRDTYEQEVAAAIAVTPSGVMTERPTESKVEVSIPAPGTLRPYALTVHNGKVHQVVAGELIPRPGSAERVGWMRQVMDALTDLWHAEANGLPTEGRRERLNRVYDQGAKTLGAINDRQNRNAFRLDPDAPNLFSLEIPATNTVEDDETEDSDTVAKPTWQKGPAFTRATLAPPFQMGKADNAEQGVAASLGRTGTVSVDAVAEAMGVSPKEAEKSIRASSAAYEDPAGGWQTRHTYLSGNVKAKLAAAKAAAADDRRFEGNVKALEAVIPADITPTIGASWVPKDALDTFIQQMMPGIRVSPADMGSWMVEGESRSDEAFNAWGYRGTLRNATPSEILAAALNGTRVDMSVTHDGKTTHDPEGERGATEKVNELRERFTQWIMEPSQGQLLDITVQAYNDIVNVNHFEPVSYEWMTFPGMNQSIRLDQHQLRGIARIALNRSAFLSWEVGTGKSFGLIGAAVEMKRMGVARKPVVATMNSLVQQIGRDAALMYPGRSILVQPPTWGAADAPTGRRAFYARLANQDFDIAIVSHETITSLPNDPAFEASIVKEDVDEAMAAYEAAAGEQFDPDAYDEDGKPTKSNKKARGRDPKARLVATIAKRIIRSRKRMSELQAHVLKVDNITFQQTGIDFLLVDEAHAFKNMVVHTTMEGVKGLGSTEDTKRSTDLLVKARALAAIHGPDKGLVLATGTPISNTITEVFAYQKMLQSEALRSAGLHHFDAWARAFATRKDSNEVQPDGTRKAVTRFAQWVNLSGLTGMLRPTFDVTLSSHIPRVAEALPVVREFQVKVPYTAEQRAYREFTGKRIAAIKGRKGPPEKGMDIVLTAFRDAQLAAIDMRMVDPSATAMHGSKIPMLVQEVANNYRTAPRIEVLKRDQNGKPTEAKESPNGAYPVQFIFQDVQTNPNTWGFSLNQEIVERLVEAGIPRDRITVMDGNMSKVAVARIKQEAAQGKYAVIIGSTQVVGTGTNAQTFAYAGYHIDAPHVPASIIQRDGRFVRQGNLYRWIETPVIAGRVVTEGTMDEALWQRLGIKWSFISNFLGAIASNDLETNSADEVQVDGFDPEMTAAMASGDQSTVRLIELEQEYGKLRRQADQHAAALRYNKDKAANQAARAIRYTEDARAIGAESARRVPLLPKKAEITAKGGTLDGAGLTKELEAHAAVDAPHYHKDYRGDGPILGTFAGEKVKLEHIRIQEETQIEKGQPVKHRFYEFQLSNGGKPIYVRGGPAALGAMRAQVNGLAEQAAYAEHEAAVAAANAAEAKARVEATGPFPRQDHLDQVRTELRALQAEIDARPAMAETITPELRDRFQAGMQARKEAKEKAEREAEARKAVREAKTGGPKDAAGDLGLADGPVGDDSPERDGAFFLNDDDGAADREPVDSMGDLAAPRFTAGNVPLRIKPAPLAGGNVTRLDSIIMDFGQALTGAGLGKTAFTNAGLRATQKGVYKPSSGQTAIRHNNLDAAAHEIAHRVDDFFPITIPATTDKKAVRQWKAAMKELHWFSYFGSQPGPGLSRSAKQAYYRAEGWAEWLRAYIVNPDEARQAAPSMEAMYEQRVPQAVRDAIDAYSRQVREFAGLDASKRSEANIRGVKDASAEASKAGVVNTAKAAAQEIAQYFDRAAGNTGAGDGTKARKADIPDLNTSSMPITWADKTTFGWYDSWWPAIKGYRTALAMKGGPAPLIENNFETLTRLAAGFADRVDSMFQDGLTSFKGKPLTDNGQRMNLEWLLEPATKAGLTKAEIEAELDAAMAQGVEERTVEEGVRNLEKARELAKAFKLQLQLADPTNPDIDKMTMAYLKERVAEAREKNSRITGIAGGLSSDYEQARQSLRKRGRDSMKAQARRAEILRRYRRWADAILDYTEEAGAMGPDQIAAIKHSHQAYIDLHRVVETESASIPTKAFKGSSRTIENPLINLMHATWSAIQWADRNRVRQSFVDALELPRGLHQGDVKDTHALGYRVSDEEMKRGEDGGKLDSAGKIDGRRPYAVRQIVTKKNEKTGKDQTVAETQWWVFDPAIEAGFEAAHAMDNPSAVGDLMEGLKKITQKTITLSPGFLIRQVQRDTISRLITTEAGSGMLDLIDGYRGDLAGKSVIERYKSSGAGQAGYDERGKKGYERRLAGVIHDAVHDGNRVLTTARMLGRGYMAIAAESDLANRRAEFARAWRKRYAQEKQDGASEEDAQLRADMHAASHARGLMDFAIAGHQARKINKVIVFFNAAMQAQRRMVRAFGPTHRKTTIARTVLMGAASGIIWAIAQAMMDDKEKEEARNRPAYKRDFAWSFKLGKNLWLDVPKPYEWGVMASAVERALDQANGDKHAWNGYIDINPLHSSSVRNAFFPLKEEMMAGSFKPFIEAMTNYSWFTDRNIVPQYENGKDMDLRKGTKNASEVGQAIQKAIGVDARKVDHVLGSMFGGFGRIATARSTDPGWWAGAVAGMSSRSPSYEARDVEWVMAYADKRGIAGREVFTRLRSNLKKVNEATNAAERDRLAQDARAQATRLRALIEANPKVWNAAP